MKEINYKNAHESAKAVPLKADNQPIPVFFHTPSGETQQLHFPQAAQCPTERKLQVLDSC